MKKLITIFIAFSIAFSMLAIPAQAAAFTDIDGHWAQTDIEKMAEAGYLNGYEDGTFRPDKPVTRAEFAKIITEAYDLTTNESGWLIFDDISPDDWYVPYVLAYWTLVDWQLMALKGEYGWPEQLGGIDVNYFASFESQRPLTRIEAAQALHFVTGIPDGSEEEMCYQVALGAADCAEFIDNRGITVLIGEVMYKGLMNGDDKGNFRPYDSITRAEVCTLINRAISNHDISNVDEYIRMYARYIESEYLGKDYTDKNYNALYEALAKDFLSENKKTDIDNIIVAVINGEPVSLADFNFLYYQYEEYQRSYLLYMGGIYIDDDVFIQSVKQMTFEALAEIIMAGQKAEKTNIVSDPVENKTLLIIKTFGGDYELFLSLLEEYHTSEYAFDKYMKNLTLADKLKADMSNEMSARITEDEIGEKFTKASHVLILIDEDTTEEEALAKAEEVIAKLDAGEDMAVLIAEYGEDPGMEYADYYLFTEGEMVDEFYEGARSLAPGEYSSEPVKTGYGYHVIYRFPIMEGDSGYDIAAKKVAYNMVEEIFAAWDQEAEIQVFDEILDQALAQQRQNNTEE